MKCKDIFNVDETGVTTLPEGGKVIASMGKKVIGRIASAEKGRTVTVVATVGADGRSLPPMMIFPRKRMNDRLLAGCIPGTAGFVSSNGWMDYTAFSSYLDHFIKHVHPTADRKVLLILDNHVSHHSLEAITKARDNGIIMLSLPPHTSSKMQPLDIAVFKPFKTYYAQQIDKWMVNHVGMRVTEYDIAQLMKPAYLKATVPSNIISGFEAAGIFPYNPDKVAECDCIQAAAAVTVEQPVARDADNE